MSSTDKITIIFRGYTWPGTLSPYQGDGSGTPHRGISKIMAEYFRFVHYEDSPHFVNQCLKSFDPKDTVVITQVNDMEPWWNPLTDAGYRLIVSSVTETKGWSRWRWPKVPDQIWCNDPKDPYYRTYPNSHRLPKGTMILTCPNWFWYENALKWESWRGHPMKYTHEKTALVPIGRSKKFRDYLYHALRPHRSELLMSYTEHGIQLPDDLPISVGLPRLMTHVNPCWYENTSFSIVAESWTGAEPFFYPKEPVFVTEKTFKPIVHQHPFMILGMKGTLAYLKSQGFKTFDNLFDESYDQCDNWKDRCDIILDNFKKFKKIKQYDSETLDRIQYNHRFYFSLGIVEDRLRTQIAQPIIDYVRST